MSPSFITRTLLPSKRIIYTTPIAFLNWTSVIRRHLGHTSGLHPVEESRAGNPRKERAKRLSKPQAYKSYAGDVPISWAVLLFQSHFLLLLFFSFALIFLMMIFRFYLCTVKFTLFCVQFCKFWQTHTTVYPLLRTNDELVPSPLQIPHSFFVINTPATPYP